MINPSSCMDENEIIKCIILSLLLLRRINSSCLILILRWIPIGNEVLVLYLSSRLLGFIWVVKLFILVSDSCRFFTFVCVIIVGNNYYAIQSY